MVSTVRPKASATPAKPIPNSGKPAASTALPQPPRTSQKVPMSSAVQRFDNEDMMHFSREKTAVSVSQPHQSQSEALQRAQRRRDAPRREGAARSVYHGVFHSPV